MHPVSSGGEFLAFGRGPAGYQAHDLGKLRHRFASRRQCLRATWLVDNRSFRVFGEHNIGVERNHKLWARRR